MTVKTFYATRPRQLSEVLKYEVHQDYSRESGTAKAGSAIDLGQILGAITAAGADKGKIVPWTPTATDGSQAIIGVSQTVVDPDQTDDSPGVVYSARASVLAQSGLRGLDTLTAAQVADALAELLALGIVVRPF